MRNWFEWLKAELRYRITRKKYDVVMTDRVKKQLSEIPEEDRKMIEDAIEKISRNPFVGERVSQEELEEMEDISNGRD